MLHRAGYDLDKSFDTQKPSDYTRRRGVSTSQHPHEAVQLRSPVSRHQRRQRFCPSRFETLVAVCCVNRFLLRTLVGCSLHPQLSYTLQAALRHIVRTLEASGFCHLGWTFAAAVSRAFSLPSGSGASTFEAFAGSTGIGHKHFSRRRPVNC